MTCDPSRLIGHALDAPDARIEAHVKRCADCSREIGRIRRLDDDLAQVYRYRSIMAAIRIQPERPRRKIYAPLFALVGLGAAAFLFIAGLPSTDKELNEFSARIVQLDSQAEKLLDEKKYAEAVKVYDQLLAQCAKLSPKAREKFGDGAAVYKGKKMHAEKMQTLGSAEAKKVSQFIEEAEAIKADFKLETAAPFLHKWEWVLRASQGDHVQAKALFKELESRRDMAAAAIKHWTRDQAEFDRLMRDRDYPGARRFVDEFLAACKDPGERDKARIAGEQIVPYAREHLKRVKSALARKKEPSADLRKEFDDAVERHFKGILPQADLDKAWEEIHD